MTVDEPAPQPRTLPERFAALPPEIQSRLFTLLDHVERLDTEGRTEAQRVLLAISQSQLDLPESVRDITNAAAALVLWVGVTAEGK